MNCERKMTMCTHYSFYVSIFAFRAFSRCIHAKRLATNAFVRRNRETICIAFGRVKIFVETSASTIVNPFPCTTKIVVFY